MRAFVALGVAAALLGACGGERDAVQPAPRADVRGDVPAAGHAAPVAARARSRAVVRSCAGAFARLGDSTIAYAATATGDTLAYRRPAGTLLGRFGRLNVNGVPTVFSVVGEARCGGRWLRVQLPVRPNGSSGWVRARDVSLRPVRTRIVVDLSERAVVVFRGSRQVLRATAAIGAPGTPTPTGSYYVNQRLVAPDPGGPFGPAAVGISAFSPVLQGWTQGGPVAIHGTNRPDLLGLAVSHGCVRIRNDALRALWRLAPAGTPVVIRV